MLLPALGSILAALGVTRGRLGPLLVALDGSCAVPSWHSLAAIVPLGQAWCSSNMWELERSLDVFATLLAQVLVVCHQYFVFEVLDASRTVLACVYSGLGGGCIL